MKNLTVISECVIALYCFNVSKEKKYVVVSMVLNTLANKDVGKL